MKIRVRTPHQFCFCFNISTFLYSTYTNCVMSKVYILELFLSALNVTLYMILQCCNDLRTQLVLETTNAHGLTETKVEFVIVEIKYAMLLNSVLSAFFTAEVGTGLGLNIYLVCLFQIRVN